MLCQLLENKRRATLDMREEIIKTEGAKFLPDAFPLVGVS
jgi:hypothetical protein